MEINEVQILDTEIINDVPELKFLGETPRRSTISLTTATMNKSPCSSPITEDEQSELMKTIEQSIQRAIENAIPNLVIEIQKEIKATREKSIDDALQNFRNEISTKSKGSYLIKNSDVI